MISFDIRLDNLLNAQVTGSGANSSELDLRNTIGNIFLSVSARVGGTNTMSIAVEHAEESGGTFDPVPASALFNTLTGEAATFDDVAALASDQFLGLNRQQLRRYVRVVLSGTTLTQEVAVTAAVQPQMTEYAV